VRRRLRARIAGCRHRCRQSQPRQDGMGAVPSQFSHTPRADPRLKKSLVSLTSI
jgi:hypothetical protein